MDRKALLILHGKQATNEAVRKAVMQRREDGWDLAVRVTWEGGDAERYVREALERGYRTVIAGGGDGSVRDITQALMASGESDLTLAVIPLGTANDLATAAGIPEAPADALSLLERPAAPVDVIQVNDSYFLNMATGGFGTEVTTQTSEDLKELLGGAAYLLTGLTRFAEVRPAEGEFEGPDFHWKGEFLALGIGNSRQAGGGQRLCPEALIDDGLMDVAILPSEVDLLGGVRGLFRSGENGGKEGLFERARLDRLTIHTPEAMHLNLDGEPLKDTRFELKVLPKALHLALPEDSALLS
ncbi:lipid kinase [Alcanivorax sp. 521-1]|uniref:Probable lipid kinase YegS-like n=1 Tax=Alloalcanivorax profundimaris TaxID=2735259 RepID=A0ABS0ANL6_9GAMM|nr:lipid kinase YegS [Alloalcanivorax profundimaris]MBF5055729.1 lipid kinase [Alloalcanivorax profundimaris]